MSVQCSKCGMPTNSSSGVCAPCQVTGRVEENFGGEKMSKDKQCSVEGCTNPQKSRGLCNKHYLQALTRGLIQTKKRSSNSKNKEIAVIPAKAGIQNKELDSLIKSENDNPGSNGKYIITVDFSRYLKLYERLINLAHKEFRTADFQLMHILNQKVQEMEERVCQ